MIFTSVIFNYNIIITNLKSVLFIYHKIFYSDHGYESAALIISCCCHGFKIVDI